MRREFVRTRTFERNWEACGLTDDDLRGLERTLLENPDAGAVIPHLAGGRKLRVALDSRGKSSGARVVYVDVIVQERIYLLLAYPKSVQADLTSEQRKPACAGGMLARHQDDTQIFSPEFALDLCIAKHSAA